MSTMKAVRIHEYGAPDVLRYEDAPRPTPGADDVLVRVLAVGINPVDWKTRAGSGTAGMWGHPLPVIVGWDVAGVVESVGADVTTFQPGDAVFGMVHFPQVGAAYAQYVVAPEDHLARKPANVDVIHAAAVPLAALTAWQGLVEHGALRSGQRVLINGASGGVGQLAVQIAKVQGAQVVATSAPDAIALVRSMGADEVVDYTAGPVEDAIAPVDLVFDAVGSQTATRALRAIKPGGRLVTIAGAPERAAAEAAQVTLTPFLVGTNTMQIRQIAELMAAGKLASEIHAVLPLHEAAQAHRLGEAGHLRGKLVLEVEH